MDTEVIKRRNIEELERLRNKYEIKEDLNELMNFYQSIYLHHDNKLKRTRLLGSKLDYVIGNDGQKHKTGKKKTVQLYVISKSMYKSTPEDNLLEILYDLNEFVLLFNQLKDIKDLEELEHLYEAKTYLVSRESIKAMKGKMDTK